MDPVIYDDVVADIYVHPIFKPHSNRAVWIFFREGNGGVATVKTGAQFIAAQRPPRLQAK